MTIEHLKSMKLPVPHRRDLEGLEMHLHFPGFDLRKVQDVVDQREQVLARRLDLLEIGKLVLSPRIFGVLRENLAITNDSIERGAQLMGHVG
jgi:hypothetical protein